MANDNFHWKDLIPFEEKPETTGSPLVQPHQATEVAEAKVRTMT
jgi:hypothetical protein